MSAKIVDGLAPSFVVTPTELRWSKVKDFLVERFPHLPEAALLKRLSDGQIYYDDGQSVQFDAPCIRGQRLWYYREINNERPIPFDYDILFEDENIIVVDKPHFLSTTPVGNHLKETVVTRLRKRTGNMAIAPAHRLDRFTAGVLLLTKKADVREKYQHLFQERKVRKTYEAICHHHTNIADEFTLSLRMMAIEGSIFMKVASGKANSHTLVRVLKKSSRYLYLELKPVTGKKHQLRLHCSHIGNAIVNDPWYPVAHPEQPDDFSKPLQLLSKTLTFTDPITNHEHCFSSKRKLKALLNSSEAS